MKINYVISEGNGKWVDTSAATLASAKRAASRMQSFQGSDLFVGVRRDETSVDVVAKKLHRYALDMSATRGWQDIV